jgi:hypothetical protein
VNSLEAYFPAGSPVVHLLKAPAAFPQNESDHLVSKGHFEEGSEVLEVTPPPVPNILSFPPLKA